MIPTLLSSPLGRMLQPMLERVTQNTTIFPGQNNFNAAGSSDAALQPNEPPNTFTSE